MSRDEFLFDHDLIDVSIMLNQLVKGNKEEKTEEEFTETPAVNFL